MNSDNIEGNIMFIETIKRKWRGLMKDLKFRKISKKIDNSLPIIKIKDITNDLKQCVLDVVINKVYIEKKEDRTYIQLYISDDFGSIYALSVQENKYYDELVKNINLHDRYHIMGYLVDYNDGLGKMFNFNTTDKVLLIQAMEDITQKEVDKYFDSSLCGESIICLYDLNVEDSYEFIKKNFNYLDNIELKDVKNIKFSWNKNILILLSNGDLLINGSKKYSNINNLVFISGVSIFGITNELQIINVLNDTTPTSILNNNNYKYKKIYYDYSKIVALTYDNKLKIFGCLFDEFIDSDRLIDVQDIGVIANKNDDIIVVQDDLIYSLFSQNTYKNKKIDYIDKGEGKTYSILVNDIKERK